MARNFSVTRTTFSTNSNSSNVVAGITPVGPRRYTSVTERVAVIARVRKLAVGVAEAWMAQQNAEILVEAVP